MRNVPDDWDQYYTNCSECGTRYHASEGCDCDVSSETESSVPVAQRYRAGYLRAARDRIVEAHARLLAHNTRKNADAELMAQREYRRAAALVRRAASWDADQHGHAVEI